MHAKCAERARNTRGTTWELGSVSRKSRTLFGAEKPFVKLRPACSVKLVFSYIVKGIKIKIPGKFRPSWRLRFEDAKKIISPEMGPKSFGTFEKRVPYWPDQPVSKCNVSLLPNWKSSISSSLNRRVALARKCSLFDKDWCAAFAHFPILTDEIHD